MQRAITAVLSLLTRLPGFRRHAVELAHVQQQREHLRAKTTALHRRLMAGGARQRAEILADVLPLRIAALRSRKMDAAVTAARARRFADLSTGYRAALGGAAAPPASGAEVVIGGVRWSIPADAADAGTLAGRLHHEQRLPLEDIVRTRELALGPVMIDIGANIGTTSIPRVVLGDFGCVYAAEPDPANYACLVRNVVNNGLQGRVMPDAVAISDRSGTVWLRRSSQIGTHHLIGGDHPAGDTVEVPTRSLDEWVAQLGIDLDELTFVKCDTQGSEVRVLRGAREVLRARHIAWELEFSPAMLERAGTSAAEFFDLVRASFTHFIDLGHMAGGRRRPTADIAAALAYVQRRERRYTDVLVYNAGRQP